MGRETLDIKQLKNEKQQKRWNASVRDLRDSESVKLKKLCQHRVQEIHAGRLV
jgi:hypothetical protein